MNADVSEIEITREDLDPKHVRRRVKDWQQRVKDVMQSIREWAAHRGATVSRQPDVMMNEEVMQRYDVKPVSLPSLSVMKGGNLIKVVPRGLWTIGANGRIDLITTKGLYMLVDFSEPFSTPEWKVYGPDRRKGVAFTEDAFFGLL